MEENTKLQAEYSMPNEYETLPKEYPDSTEEIYHIGDEFNENVKMPTSKKTVKRSVQKSFMLLGAVVATSGVIASSSAGGLQTWWGTSESGDTFFDSAEMTVPTDTYNSSEIYTDSNFETLPETQQIIYFPELDSAMEDVLTAVKTEDSETIINCFKEHNEVFQDALTEYFGDYDMATIAYDGEECYLTFAMGLGGIPHKNNQLLIDVNQTYGSGGVGRANYRVWQGDFSQSSFQGRVDYMDITFIYDKSIVQEDAWCYMSNDGTLHYVEEYLYQLSGEFKDNALIGTWTMKEDYIWSEFVVSGEIGPNEELTGLVTLSGIYENGEAWQQQVNVDENGCLIFDDLIFDYRGQGFGDIDGLMPLEVAELAEGRCFVTEGDVDSVTGEYLGYYLWHNKIIKDTMWHGENHRRIKFGEPLFPTESYKNMVYSIWHMCGMEKPEQY